jgi:hypothetical protein
MNGPLLTISSEDAPDLLRQLAETDIRVPRKTEGRTSQHRERYTMARFLATACTQGWLDFPLSLVHHDNTGNPDFLLTSPSYSIGVECVEAVSQSWYEIDVLRERHYAGAVVSVPKLEPGAQALSHSAKHAIACGVKVAPPWMGKDPEQAWAKAHEHFIAGKVQKLRNGNYRPLSRLWLLVQDEWSTPVHGSDSIMEAAEILVPRLPPLFATPAFEKIFILSSPLLLAFDGSGFEVNPIRNLW